MRFLFSTIGFLISLATVCSISNAQNQKKEARSEQLGHGYDFEDNGKDLQAASQNDLYFLSWNIEDLNGGIHSGGEDLLRALQIQQDYLLSKNRSHNYVGLSFNDNSIRKVTQHILDIIQNDTGADDLKLYRIEGEDTRGNVHFTAYYTPILEARGQPDDVFRYPIYRKPDNWGGKRPTRAMIDGMQVLANQNLEIAWTSNLLDNYFLQVQGSGYLQFEDGSRSLLLFEGQNGYAYTSIGKYMVKQEYIEASDISLPAIREWFNQNPDSLHPILNLNESYTFFIQSQNKVKGAANTELIPGHSIAVDPKYIPYGAVLLARIPILNEMGKLQKHEYRIVTAQDKGGAIKGPGHVDLYEGVGNAAEQKAENLHHYGTLWLILPN